MSAVIEARPANLAGATAKASDHVTIFSVPGDKLNYY